VTSSCEHDNEICAPYKVGKLIRSQSDISFSKRFSLCVVSLFVRTPWHYAEAYTNNVKLDICNFMSIVACFHVLWAKADESVQTQYPLSTV
jgi:hypothetical protein